MASQDFCWSLCLRVSLSVPLTWCFCLLASSQCDRAGQGWDFVCGFGSAGGWGKHIDENFRRGWVKGFCSCASSLEDEMLGWRLAKEAGVSHEPRGKQQEQQQGWELAKLVEEQQQQQREQLWWGEALLV
jgi:hypothetical protein